MYTLNVWTFWTLLYSYVQVQGERLHDQFIYMLSWDSYRVTTLLPLGTWLWAELFFPAIPLCFKPEGSLKGCKGDAG